MIDFGFNIARDYFFQNSFGSVRVGIERSQTNLYTLTVSLEDIGGVTNDSHISIIGAPVSMKDLQNAVETMTRLHLDSHVDSDASKAIVTFCDQFNRTNPRKRIAQRLKAVCGCLKRRYEHVSEITKVKGNLLIELVKKVYINLADQDAGKDPQKVFIRLQVIVDKLGDYHFVMYYSFLVGEHYVPGRVLLKEKVTTTDELLSIVRKGLLVAKTRNILSVFDVESFYKDCTLFCYRYEDELNDIIGRLNARLPL